MPSEQAGSEQESLLFPSLNIRAVFLEGRRYVGRGGVPAGEVPYGSVGLMLGDGVGGWTLQEGVL